MPAQSKRRLLLASASPRRHELLAQWGYAFDVRCMDIPEQRSADETPTAYVQRVALEKARAALASIAPDEQAQVVVLGADTEVVLGERVYGKPVDDADAVAMLHSLAGRTHAVLTAVAAVSDRLESVLVQRSLVRVVELDMDTIVRYVRSGEAHGKAGAYAIQGRAAQFIDHLEGSYSGVMGLPAFETGRLLAQFGIQPQS